MLDIAVIIVNYKTAALTEENIRSIAGERATIGLCIRVVVVDNASGDLPSLERAVEINHWSSWVRLVQAPRNGGFSYGNNLGMQQACAERIPDYFYVVNPDARVRSGAIGALVRFLEVHPQAGIAGSKVENLDDPDWPIAFRFPGLLSEIEQGLAISFVSRLLCRWKVARKMSDRAEAVDWVSGASMLIRRNVLAAIGGLDESYFLYYEEVDFCYRAKQAGFQTWYVPESHVLHLKGQSTGVTSRNGVPKRFPVYWFESRRRYFVRTCGLTRAMAIDAAALSAYSLGMMKRMLLRRTQTGAPHFIRDLARYTVLRPSNRRLPPLQAPSFVDLAAQSRNHQPPLPLAE